MKVASLIVCGLLVLPALAQESKPTPKPQEGPKAEKSSKQEAVSKAAVRALQSITPQHPNYQQWIERARLAADRQVAKDRHVAKVPEADQALLDIQKTAQEACSAKDLEAILEALDEIEKAVMRARAALRKSEAARKDK